MIIVYAPKDDHEGLGSVWSTFGIINNYTEFSVERQMTWKINLKTCVQIFIFLLNWMYEFSKIIYLP